MPRRRTVTLDGGICKLLLTLRWFIRTTRRIPFAMQWRDDGGVPRHFRYDENRRASFTAIDLPRRLPIALIRCRAGAARENRSHHPSIHFCLLGMVRLGRSLGDHAKSRGEVRHLYEYHPATNVFLPAGNTHRRRPTHLMVWCQTSPMGIIDFLLHNPQFN